MDPHSRAILPLLLNSSYARASYSRPIVVSPLRGHATTARDDDANAIAPTPTYTRLPGKIAPMFGLATNRPVPDLDIDVKYIFRPGPGLGFFYEVCLGEINWHWVRSTHPKLFVRQGSSESGGNVSGRDRVPGWVQ
jgi:hypothetical protein